MCTDSSLTFQLPADPLESLESYVLRTMRSNFVCSITDMRNLFGAASPAVLKFGVLSETDRQSIFTALKPLVKQDINVLNPSDHPESGLLSRVHTRRIRDGRIPYLRVCIPCLQEKNWVLPAAWQSFTVTECVTHRCSLITQCPVCDAKLAWSPDSLTQCTKCRTPWSDIERPEQGLPPSKLELEVSEHLASGAELEPSFLDDLATAILLVTRPFDYEIKSIEAFPYTADASEIIRRAYWLISSLRARQSLNQAFKREVTETLVFSGLKPNRNSDMVFASQRARSAYGAIDRWPTAEAPPVFIEDDRFIPVSLQKRLKGSTDLARFLIGLPTLGEIFGLDATEAFVLAKNSGIKLVKASNKAQTTYLNLQQLIRKAQTRLATQPDPNASPYRHDSPIYAQYLDSYANIVGLVLSGTYQGHFVASEGLQTVFMDPVYYEQKAKLHFSTLCLGRTVKVHLAAKCLGVPESRVLELIESKALRFKKPKGVLVVQGDSLRELVLNQQRKRRLEQERSKLLGRP